MNTANPTVAQHPIFSRFTPWEGQLPVGYRVNYLGMMERIAFLPRFLVTESHTTPIHIKANFPVFNEEYFEWIEVLEAACAVNNRFTMMELGAGFGRWMVTAALALRALGKPTPRLIGVEAEEMHFAWLSEHLRDNGLDPAQATLILGAVGAKDGEAMFMSGAPREWYGQAVLHPGQRAVKNIEGEAVEVKSVPSLSIATLLADLDRVDLLDVDIQGAELDAFKPARTELDNKIHRVFIGTHSAKIDAGLKELFTDMGWRARYIFPCMSKSETPFGQIEFQDGVQAWHNPRFVSE